MSRATSSLRIDEMVGEDLGVGVGEPEPRELLQDLLAVTHSAVIRIRPMIRDLLKKLFGPSSKKQSDRFEEVSDESRDMDDVRAEAQDQAEELIPGHSDRAASIGIFH